MVTYLIMTVRIIVNMNKKYVKLARDYHHNYMASKNNLESASKGIRSSSVLRIKLFVKFYYIVKDLTNGETNTITF